MATTTAVIYSFRLVVRGNDRGGTRVRRVRTCAAANLIEAWAEFAECRNDMADALTDVAFSVLPEVGLRVDGRASIGYETV